MKTFSRFALVGGSGFVIDASVFYFFIEQLSLPYSFARIVAFIIAMLITWLGNRYFSFAHANRENAKQQLVKHCSCASFSFIFNYGVFQTLILMSMPTAFSFVAGILVGLVSNYYISKKAVFV